MNLPDTITACMFFYVVGYLYSQYEENCKKHQEWLASLNKRED